VSPFRWVIALLARQSQATGSTIDFVIDHLWFDRPSGSWHSGRFADGPLTVDISNARFSLVTVDISRVPFSLLFFLGVPFSLAKETDAARKNVGPRLVATAVGRSISPH